MISSSDKTEVIQLCEATLFCTKNAAFLATFVHKGVTSKPVACCEDHRMLCQERADHLRVGVEFASISGAQPS